MKKALSLFYNVLRNLSLFIVCTAALLILSIVFVPRLVKPISEKICELSQSSSQDDFFVQQMSSKEEYVDYEEVAINSVSDNRELIKSVKTLLPIKGGKYIIDENDILFIEINSSKKQLVTITLDTVTLESNNFSLNKIYSECLSSSNQFIKGPSLLVNRNSIRAFYTKKDITLMRESSYHLKFENIAEKTINKSFYNMVKNSFL